MAQILSIFPNEKWRCVKKKTGVTFWKKKFTDQEFLKKQKAQTEILILKFAEEKIQSHVEEPKTIYRKNFRIWKY